MARHVQYCWNPRYRRFTRCTHGTTSSRRSREKQDTPVVAFVRGRRAQATARTPRTRGTDRSTTQFRGSKYQHVPKARTYRTAPRGVPDYPTWPLRYRTRPGGVWRIPYRFPIWR